MKRVRNGLIAKGLRSDRCAGVVRKRLKGNGIKQNTSERPKCPNVATFERRRLEAEDREMKWEDGRGKAQMEQNGHDVL